MSDSIIIYITFILLVIVAAINIYLLISRQKKETQDNSAQEIDKLKQDINSSLSTMTTSFNQEFTNLSTDFLIFAVIFIPINPEEPE